MTDRRIFVWKYSVIQSTETFIRNQMDGMVTWQPQLFGALRIHSALSRDSDVVLFGNGRVDRFLATLTLKFGGTPRVTQYLRQTHPALVHAHFLPDGWAISGSAIRARVPLLVTAHGNDATAWPAAYGLMGAARRYRLRKLFARANLIIAVSEFIQSKVIALGADPAKVVVHHIGIPIEPLSEVRPKPEWDVVFVGRLVEKKGIFDLLDALAILARNRVVKAALVGSGSLEVVARARAAHLGLNVAFLGSKSPAEVREIMLRGRVFAAPSKTASDGDSEGLPMVVLEAASAGLPVVATWHSGIPEAVLDGVTGLLSPEGDTRALACNINRLLNDPALSARLGAAGRTRVVDKFDIATQTEELERIYDRVAAEADR